jgi:hypothetical protein
MHVPAVSLQGQGIVFKKKCIDCSNPIGKYKLVYYARLVHERSVERPELEIPQIALITGIILVSPRRFLQLFNKTGRRKVFAWVFIEDPFDEVVV